MVSILDKIIREKQYDKDLDDIWANFKRRIYTKVKLEDLSTEIKEEVLNFILDMYKKNIFIMKNGELEDYYIKENFEEEVSNISGKGIIAYKVAELSQINGIDKYIRINEYKDILSHIIGKRRIKGYKSLNRKCYKRIKKEE